MSNFDFDVDRSKESSAKYDEMVMKYGRGDLYSLWVADMDFEVAEPIYKAIEERSKMHIYGYTARPDSYYDAFQSWYEKKYGFMISRDSIIHSPGVVTSLSLAVRELTKNDAKIIIQPPVYYPFFDAVNLNGRTLLKNRLVLNGGKYEINFEEFEEMAKEADWFILCNPHNPVGRVWNREELERIGEICIRNNVRVISDEIHGELVYRRRKYIPFASISKEFEDMTITCLSATKPFNIAGLQASSLLVPRKEEKKKIDDFFTSLDIKRNNCFSLVAVEAAFSGGEKWLEEMLDYVDGNIQYVNEFCAERLQEIVPNEPEGTYLIWMDFRALKLSDEQLFDFMVNKALIAPSMGTGFGEEGSGYVRLNLACPRKTIVSAMESLERAVKELRDNYKK